MSNNEKLTSRYEDCLLSQNDVRKIDLINSLQLRNWEIILCVTWNKYIFSFLYVGIVILVFFGITACESITKHDEDGAVSNLFSRDSLNAYSILPKQVSESSGLLYYKNHIWTLNDSGQGPFLYQLTLDSTKLVKRVGVLQCKNKDWEDMTQDDTHFYIGDFGNNKGTRKDLVIYKIKKEDLDKTIDNFVQAESIHFSYPEQKNFMSRRYNHNFDCEAMVASGDSLFIFTKNHQNLKTNCYRLPKAPGSYAAQLEGSFDVKGTITAATIDPETKTLCLLGYQIKGGFVPFIWLFYDYPNQQFFEGKSKGIRMEMHAQTEGICFLPNGQCLLSQEKEMIKAARTFLFEPHQWLMD